MTSHFFSCLLGLVIQSEFVFVCLIFGFLNRVVAPCVELGEMFFFPRGAVVYPAGAMDRTVLQ